MRKAIDASEKLSTRNIEVFAQGSYGYSYTDYKNGVEAALTSYFGAGSLLAETRPSMSTPTPTASTPTWRGVLNTGV